MRYGALTNDLNLRTEYRWSVGLAYVVMLLLAMALLEPRVAVAVPTIVAGLTALNHRYYRFFYRKRGAFFTARVWLVHALQHLYCGVAFAMGLGLFVAAKHLSLRLPGALPVDPWSASLARLTPGPRVAPVLSADPAGSA